jgi:micrococcal nuclease
MTARTATLLILLLTQPAVFGVGGTFTGRVERVIDGDTIIVRATLPSLPEVELHRIRLADIDAPELKQPHGQEAKAALTAKLLNQSVTVTWTHRGRYRRIIGTVYLHQENIAHTQVAQGHAHRYHRSSNPPSEL